MPKLKNNLIGETFAPRARFAANKNTMKRDFIFPLIVGIILGVLVMMFWQFNNRLNNQMAAMTQLETATTQNSTGLNQIVSYLQGGTQSQTAATPATTPTTTTKK